MKKHTIVSVNQAHLLSRRVWTDDQNKQWSWSEVVQDPQLMEAVMTWQMEHHQQLRSTAIESVVPLFTCNDVVRILMFHAFSGPGKEVEDKV